MLGKRGSAHEDIIGRWSEEKLDLLQKYLRAYSTIMNDQRWWLKAYHYIDAFAGPVRHKAKEIDHDAEQHNATLFKESEAPAAENGDRDVERYIDGSPLRALETQPPFDVCWFIELSRWRSRQLDRLREQFPGRDIRIRRGDCNEILRRDVVSEITKASKQRGVVFLDPYGLHIEWETVEALARAETLDIFVNFSLMHPTRLLKRDESPDESVVNILSKGMGNTNWAQAIYKASLQTSMFDDQIVGRDVIRAEWLASIYADQVGQLFPFVSNPVIMKSYKNAPLYALFLASHNKTAIKIMNEIFAKYERLKKLGK